MTEAIFSFSGKICALIPELMIIVSGFESISDESLTSLGGILSYPGGFFGLSDVRYDAILLQLLVGTQNLYLCNSFAL